MNAKPIQKRLTVRMAPALFKDFQETWKRRGFNQNAAAVQALREWANPPLPANDNDLFAEEDKSELMLAIVMLLTVFAIGVVVGALVF